MAMERTVPVTFDPDAIDGDGQSRPIPQVPLVGETEHSCPLAGVLVCTSSSLFSLAVLLWAAGQIVRAVLR